MARIVIEEPCEHDKMGKHLLAERRNDPCGGQCGAAHTASDPHFDCPGGSRRVLDPGSYVRYMGVWNDLLPIYDQLPVVTRAALAHLHGRHDEPTAYCPLCGFDPDALAGGEQP